MLSGFMNKIAEKIDGGLGDGRKDTEFDPVQLAKGIKVELEHAYDFAIAKEIAKDHLTEDPKYYDHLEEMEEDAYEEMCEKRKELREAKIFLRAIEHYVK
jgi:hypothetical protein